ncbi:hypothetical protein GCM10017687_19920 [Streptomyces echinatus]
MAGLVPAGQRTGLLARLQSTSNGGLAVGAALGGLALSAGTAAAYRGVLALDALCFLGCALLLLRLPAVTGTPTPTSGTATTLTATTAAGTDAGGRRFAVLRDRPYAVVALLNTVLLLRLPLLSLALPLWITERTAAPAWLASGLFVLNTLAVTLFQVRAARGRDGARHRSAGPAPVRARDVRLLRGVRAVAGAVGLARGGDPHRGCGAAGRGGDAAVGGLLAVVLRSGTGRADGRVPGLLRHRG